ncbi:NAD(P)-binding protein [Hypoxylon sp. EC38]|nr:NAD(P)-binding protein [Hypoxylon sp. EC38]
MTRKNHTFHLAERPQGLIMPGRTFNLVETDMPTADELKDGQALVETIWLSPGPSMRSWLVLASKSSKAKEGDLVFSINGWTELSIVNEVAPEANKLTTLCALTGITGMSAYFGMKYIGQPKAGDTVIVSAVVGPTGSVAGQIAKIKGARVVGITGSDEKCEMLTKELGFDVALNYKSPAFDEDLAKATPDNIDAFGVILEKAMNCAALHARFALCGCISEYNKLDQPDRGDYTPEFPGARQQLGQRIAEGKLKRLETVVEGEFP